jgi:hypothetical protein
MDLALLARIVGRVVSPVVGMLPEKAISGWCVAAVFAP